MISSESSRIVRIAYRVWNRVLFPVLLGSPFVAVFLACAVGVSWLARLIPGGLGQAARILFVILILLAICWWVGLGLTAGIKKKKKAGDWGVPSEGGAPEPEREVGS